MGSGWASWLVAGPGLAGGLGLGWLAETSWLKLAGRGWLAGAGWGWLGLGLGLGLGLELGLGLGLGRRKM